MKQQPIRVDTMRGNRCTSSACDALAAEQCNATPHRAIPTYPVQYPRATSTIKNPDSTASVEDTGGSRESSCGARGRRRGLAVVRTDTQPRKCRRCGGRRRVRRARAGFEIDHSEPKARVWRSRGRPGPTAPRTPAVPQATKQQGQGVGGPGCGTHGRRQGLAGLRGEAPPHTATQAPPVRRAPEGPEGQGGLRDRPLRAKGSRVAISRAAGPDGAQNTSGAAKQPGPDTRKPRPADAGRGQPTQSGGKV